MNTAEQQQPEELDSGSMKMWRALHGAFDFFNERLFHGKLDRNMVILNCSRQNRALGFFRPPAIGWKDEEGNEKVEISLNPDYMGGRSIDDTYSTLVHEMCHMEQETCPGGKPGKRGYHNKQWSEMMLAVGLKPYNISNPSKMTGPRCSHEIIPAGSFDQAMKIMPEELKIPFTGLKVDKGQKAKVGYKKWTCSSCGQVARAKDNAELVCFPCTLNALDELGLKQDVMDALNRLATEDEDGEKDDE